MTTDTLASFISDLLLGGLSAAIARSAVAPFKTVRAALEFQKTSMHGMKLTPYAGVWDCFLRMPKEQGFLRLWRGNLMTMYQYAPVHAFNFAFRNWYKHHIPTNSRESSNYDFFKRNILAGSLAATTTQFIMHPFLICHYMAVTAKDQPTDFKRLKECIITTAKNRGIAGFYQGFYGFTITLSVYRGLYYSLYDSGKIRLKKYHLESNMLAHFILAQMATATAGVIAYPMDHTVWRTLEDSRQASKKRKYRGVLDCWMKTFYSEGPIGFFSGCLTSLLRSTVTALVLVFYDEFDHLRSVELTM